MYDLRYRICTLVRGGRFFPNSPSLYLWTAGDCLQDTLFALDDVMSVLYDHRVDCLCGTNFNFPPVFN